MTLAPNRSKLIGLLLGTAAALIGGAWQVLTRLATTSTTAKLDPVDLALLRYAIPALVLLPLLRRGGLWPRGVSKPALLVVLGGAGLPFGWVAMSGTRFAPAAHMGVLMAGASPLLAALLAWAIWRERPIGLRALGLVGMAVGVGLLGWRSIGTMDLVRGAATRCFCWPRCCGQATQWLFGAADSRLGMAPRSSAFGPP
jgi:drug/metabolite transporter (DMT)-like permease